MSLIRWNATRRQVGFLLVMVVGALAPASQARAQTNLPTIPRRASIILVLAQGLRFDDIGCYGQAPSKTPHLDELAGEGIRFTGFYAGSVAGQPSRAALMLGQHTGHLRIRDNASGQSLAPEDVTVSEVLMQAGYHTGCIGLWGLATSNSTGLPQKMGFDEWIGFVESIEAREPYPAWLWRYDSRSGHEGTVRLFQNENRQKGETANDIFTRAAAKFIENNSPDLFNRYQPFFLMLSYPIPSAGAERAAEIGRLDEGVGRLVEALEKRKITENTAIFLTSDAGARPGNRPDLLSEANLRVPMLVSWPARIRARQVSDDAWAAWDFLPTAAAIAYTKSPAGIDGISMLPLISGQAQTNRHEFFYWETDGTGLQQTLRLGDWKGIRRAPGKPLELYNLKTDRAGRQNVAANHADVVAKIEQLMKDAHTEPVPNPKPEPNGAH